MNQLDYESVRLGAKDYSAFVTYWILFRLRGAWRKTGEVMSLAQIVLGEEAKVVRPSILRQTPGSQLEGCVASGSNYCRQEKN
jgi:hypothetical protein